MFGLGAPELLLILAIILVIFGAGKLPQVFGALGKGVKEFRDASDTPEITSTTTTTTNPAGNASSTTVVRQENVISPNGIAPTSTTPVV